MKRRNPVCLSLLLGAAMCLAAPGVNVSVYAEEQPAEESVGLSDAGSESAAVSSPEAEETDLPEETASVQEDGAVTDAVGELPGDQSAVYESTEASAETESADALFEDSSLDAANAEETETEIHELTLASTTEESYVMGNSEVFWVEVSEDAESCELSLMPQLDGADTDYDHLDSITWESCDRNWTPDGDVCDGGYYEADDAGNVILSYPVQNPNENYFWICTVEDIYGDSAVAKFSFSVPGDMTEIIFKEKNQTLSIDALEEEALPAGDTYVLDWSISGGNYFETDDSGNFTYTVGDYIERVRCDISPDYTPATFTADFIIIPTENDEYEYDETLTSFEECDVDIGEGSPVLFILKPSASGIYDFYSAGTEELMGVIADSDGGIVAWENANDGTDFMVRAALTAGEEYLGFVFPSSVSDTVSFTTGFYLEHTHDYQVKVDTAATCTKAGQKSSHCTICGEVKEGSVQTIPAVGHKFSAWKTTVKPTAVRYGKMTRTCSVCRKTETKTIAKLPAKIAVNVTSLQLKVRQSTNGVKVTRIAYGDRVVSWTSSNRSIATVAKKGAYGSTIKAGNKAGKAVITVKLASGKTAKIYVTVLRGDVKATRLTLTSAKTVTLTRGKTSRITVSRAPFTVTEKITYTSANKRIATVDSYGKITAKKKGTTTITVKSGSKKVYVKVVVK